MDTVAGVRDLARLDVAQLAFDVRGGDVAAALERRVGALVRIGLVSDQTARGRFELSGLRAAESRVVGVIPEDLLDLGFELGPNCVSRYDARRSPRGRDDARGDGTDRATRARRRAPIRDDDGRGLARSASRAPRPRDAIAAGERVRQNIRPNKTPSLRRRDYIYISLHEGD